MALVLLNPHARGGRGARLAAPLHEALATLAPHATLCVADTVDEGRAAITALSAGSRVVVVGGDGTLHQLLGALHRHGCETALVPAGSGDDSARAFGLRGLAWRDALMHALRAPAVPIDLGELRTGADPASAGTDTRLFVSSLACGFDAAVALRALAGPPALAGLLRYLWATFGELSALQRRHMRVRVDGREVHEGDTLFASTLNTPTYGGGMPAAPTARIGDGQLDLLLAGAFGQVGTLAMLPRLLVGAHLGHPRVALHGGRHLRIESDRPLPLAADGEAVPASRHVDVRVRPQALRMVVGPNGHVV